MRVIAKSREVWFITTMNPSPACAAALEEDPELELDEESQPSMKVSESVALVAMHAERRLFQFLSMPEFTPVSFVDKELYEKGGALGSNHARF